MPGSRPLRVAMVVKLYPPWVGGLELHVAELAERMAAAHPAASVTVVTGQERRAGFVEETRGGVRVLRAATLLRAARTPITLGLGALLRRVDADVYHFHSPFPWGEVVALGAGLRAPVVVTHYHDIVRQKRLARLHRPFLDAFLRRADRVVAWTPQAAEGSPALRAHRDRVVVIPGGIDTRRFVPTAESRARAAELRRRLAPDGPVTLFVGRLVYYKGVDHLLRAFSGVPGTLLLVGRGDLRGELEALAERLRVLPRVRFLGEVGDAELPLYYQAADLLALPSSANTEAFGLVQLEAHASGIPTVCTDLPTGVTFVNQHGRTGLVVPPRDPAALAGALNRLLADEPLRREMGRTAQRRALAEFDVGRCAERVWALYEEVLGRRAEAAA